MNRSLSFTIVAFFALASCCAAQSVQPAASAGATATIPAYSQSQQIIPAASPDTVIGPNDSITIVALDSDEISKTWRVNSEGDVALPLVGVVHVAGLTAGQLEEKLRHELKRYIRSPQVTVYVADFKSQPVTIAGAVHHPGTFQLEGHQTLLAAIALGGGPDSPGPTLILTRPVESGPIPLPGAHLDSSGLTSSVELKMSDVLNPSTAASNLDIRPNDVISLSTKPRLVYIIGEVMHPGAVELVTQDTVSVMQVLAAAGGLSHTAAPKNSAIMRIDDNGLYKPVAQIDLKRVMVGKLEDRLLKPGDIIVVPSSSLKTYTSTAGTTAITTGIYVLTRF
jgi:polysaccharide biosynthesis/export protein